MRILIPTPDFPPAHGGVQLLIERLARHLTAHDVLVLAPGQRGDREFDQRRNYQVQRVRVPGGRRSTLLALNAAIPRLARGFWPEAIISAHVICSPGALRARRALQVPVLQYAYALELGRRGWLTRTLLPRADGIVAISSYTRKLAIAAGAAPERIAVLYPGADPPPAPSAPAGEPVILTIARLEDRYKGFDVMIRAMPLVLARVPEARWVIVGDGALRPELERAVHSGGLEGAVLFPGSVSDAERDRWLARAQVFAMPSRLPASGAGEGFGIAFLEAGRFGVPSVTANEGGAAEAVLDGLTGIHVEPRDHVALAGAICELLENDELRRRCGAAARERAAQLSWVAMARGVERLLVELTGGSAPRGRRPSRRG